MKMFVLFNGFKSTVIPFVVFLSTIVFSNGVFATVKYDTWMTNENDSGNYVITVEEQNGSLFFDLTVDPWNAEYLAVFVDLGDFDAAGSGASIQKSTRGGFDNSH